MTAAARAAGVRTRALRLDPRAKLAMLAVANVLMFLHAGPAAQSLAVVLFSLPLLFGGKAAAGVRILAVYGALCAVEWASALGVDRLSWLHIAGATAAGVCMMMPCLTAGMAMFATTRPGDMVCAMRRMRAPDALVIPVVVMMRFFPTIRHDYRLIRQSLRLRGFAGGGMALARHPLRSLEYILVPLLMNAANVARDLTVAGLARGLGAPGESTSMVELRMHAVDWLAVALSLATLAVAAVTG